MSMKRDYGKTVVTKTSDGSISLGGGVSKAMRAKVGDKTADAMERAIKSGAKLNESAARAVMADSLDKNIANTVVRAATKTKGTAGMKIALDAKKQGTGISMRDANNKRTFDGTVDDLRKIAKTTNLVKNSKPGKISVQNPALGKSSSKIAGEPLPKLRGARYENNEPLSKLRGARYENNVDFDFAMKNDISKMNDAQLRESVKKVFESRLSYGEFGMNKENEQAGKRLEALRAEEAKRKQTRDQDSSLGKSGSKMGMEGKGAGPDNSTVPSYFKIPKEIVTPKVSGDSVHVSELKKGMRVMLKNGWEATVLDDKPGKIRKFLFVHGFSPEAGDVYSHEIASVKGPDGSFVKVDSTPKTKAGQRDQARVKKAMAGLKAGNEGLTDDDLGKSSSKMKITRASEDSPVGIQGRGNVNGASEKDLKTAETAVVKALNKLGEDLDNYDIKIEDGVLSLNDGYQTISQNADGKWEAKVENPGGLSSMSMPGEMGIFNTPQEAAKALVKHMDIMNRYEAGEATDREVENSPLQRGMIMSRASDKEPVGIVGKVKGNASDDEIGKSGSKLGLGEAIRATRAGAMDKPFGTGLPTKAELRQNTNPSALAAALNMALLSNTQRKQAKEITALHDEMGRDPNVSPEEFEAGKAKAMGLKVNNKEVAARIKAAGATTKPEQNKIRDQVRAEQLAALTKTKDVEAAKKIVQLTAETRTKGVPMIVQWKPIGGPSGVPRGEGGEDVTHNDVTHKRTNSKGREIPPNVHYGNFVGADAPKTGNTNLLISDEFRVLNGEKADAELTNKRPTAVPANHLQQVFIKQGKKWKELTDDGLVDVPNNDPWTLVGMGDYNMDEPEEVD